MNSTIDLKVMQKSSPVLSSKAVSMLEAAGSQLSIAVVSDAAPGRNGVGTFYVDLQEHLSCKVKHVELLCPTIESGKWKAGLVFPLPGDHTQKLCMPNPVKMYRRLKAIQPDVLIIATPGVYGMVGTFIGKRLNIPMLVGFHTSFESLTELYWGNSIKRPLIYGYFKVSNGYLFKRCKAVLVNSTPMGEQAKSLGAPDVIDIPTMISPVFTQHPIEEYAGECRSILFAGRLAPEKNLESVIQAARDLPQLQFSIAGDGPEREKIQSIAETLPNLRYLGWQSREALRDVIDQHDVLVLPSFFESYGTVILEAMARKRLVVVSAGCGIAGDAAFQSGFFTMESESLTPSLKHILAIDPEARRQKAQLAHNLTQALNDRSLLQWCRFLVDTCDAEVG